MFYRRRSALRSLRTRAFAQRAMANIDGITQVCPELHTWKVSYYETSFAKVLPLPENTQSWSFFLRAPVFRKSVQNHATSSKSSLCDVTKGHWYHTAVSSSSVSHPVTQQEINDELSSTATPPELIESPDFLLSPPNHSNPQRIHPRYVRLVNLFQE